MGNSQSKQPRSKKQYSLRTLLIVLCAAVGIGFGAGYTTHRPIVVSARTIRENTTDYKFIHPLLAVDRTDDTLSPDSQSLYNSINTFIKKEIVANDITNTSVYFIDYFGKKGSFGINEKDAYSPASLLKVVIMVGYLKKSESDSAILDSELPYTAELAKYATVIPFESPTTLQVGESYSVSSLIDKMIINSDNGAKDVLLANIGDTYLNQVYSDLGLTPPGKNPTYTISAKDYSFFFRVLYNATYLNATNSEKALSILSKATFAKGLVAGLPAGTVVAHKFGEYVNGTNDRIDSIELHDCGIVYNAKGPYLLCVMTKGTNLSSLQNTIATISKLVYADTSK